MKKVIDKVQIQAVFSLQEGNTLNSTIDTGESAHTSVLLVASKLLLDELSRRISSPSNSPKEKLHYNRMLHMIGALHREQLYHMVGQEKVLDEAKALLEKV